MSVEAIKAKYSINSENLDDIRNIIFKMRNEIHPDIIGGGAFLDDSHKSKYDDLDKDLNYIESLLKNESLIPINKITELINSLAIVNAAEYKESKLEKRIDFAISNYRSKYFIPKISVTLVSAFLTFLLAIPSQLENTYLATFNTPTLQLLWIGSILYTCLFWLITYQNEEKAKRRLSMLKVDTIQNKLVEIFFQNTMSFTKDDLVEYIYYEENKNSTFPFLKSEIVSLEIAQTIAETVIARLENKNIILKINANSMSEHYNFALGKIN